VLVLGVVNPYTLAVFIWLALWTPTTQFSIN